MSEFCPVCDNDSLSWDYYDGGDEQQYRPYWIKRCSSCGYEEEDNVVYDEESGDN